MDGIDVRVYLRKHGLTDEEIEDAMRDIMLVDHGNGIEIAKWNVRVPRPFDPRIKSENSNEFKVGQKERKEEMVKAQVNQMVNDCAFSKDFEFWKLLPGFREAFATYTENYFRERNIQ